MILKLASDRDSQYPRGLHSSEFEELCDLIAALAPEHSEEEETYDLLDFLHWLNRTAEEQGWSLEKVLTILQFGVPKV